MTEYDIAIIGLGYVGLPLALQFARAGAQVLGLDVDEEKIRMLREGRSYIHHITNASVAEQIESGRLAVGSAFEAVQAADAVVICVPTPLGANREPDISYVLKTGAAIAPFLRPAIGRQPKLVVLESTTYPGTTDKDLREVLERCSGLEAGRDFHLAFSPEREDPGNPQSRVATIPKVMGGLTPECLRRTQELYGRAITTLVPVSSTRVAEATKLTENIFRSVNIALVNELKVIFAAMDIDIWEVITAAKTKPFGYMAFYPGPGLGGHCIPIDPFYLTWKAREVGLTTRFVELAGEINTAMPDYVVQIVADALNDSRLPVRGSTILLLGMAYKEDVDDQRESPGYALMQKLETKGANVLYHDPFVPVISSSREHPELAGRTSVPLEQPCDLVLIVTAHTVFRSVDYSQWPMPVVDTRNCITPDRRPARYYRA